MAESRKASAGPGAEEREHVFREVAAKYALVVGEADAKDRLPLRLRSQFPSAGATLCRYVVQAESNPTGLVLVIRDVLMQETENRWIGTRVYS